MFACEKNPTWNCFEKNMITLKCYTYHSQISACSMKMKNIFVSPLHFHVSIKGIRILSSVYFFINLYQNSSIKLDHVIFGCSVVHKCNFWVEYSEYCHLFTITVESASENIEARVAKHARKNPITKTWFHKD